MKKKIKDLTLEEVKDLCENSLDIPSGMFKCNVCPYHHNYDCKLDYNNLDDFGEEEVEV